MLELRKITIDDTDKIVRWRNKDNVKRNLYTQSDLTKEQHLNWLNNYVEKGKCYQYIIGIRNKHIIHDIGTVFLKNVDINNKKAEFGIFIGEERYYGKGYASLASKEILRIAFEELGFNRIYLSVMSDNVNAIRVYKKVGFEYEGTLKEDYYSKNKFIDVIVMGITVSKWKRILNIKEV